MSAPQRLGNVRNLMSLSAGNAMEWFDWQIYSTLSVFFASQFFDPAHEGSSLLNSLAIFAVGFVARPIGGVLFGWLADRRGRKPAMLLTIAFVAAGSLVIGLVPAAHTIGIFSPIILLL